MFSYKTLKREIFFLKKAFFKYHKGSIYVINRFYIAKKIFKINHVLDKPFNQQNLSVHILCGHSDFVSMFWSLASYYLVAKMVGRLYIHNDGTFTTSDKKLIKKLLPNATVVETNNFIRDYSHKLRDYPTIYNFRKNYSQFFSFKKMVDPYFVSNAPIHLIIDSDILWFSQPVELENEVSQDCKNSLMMYDLTSQIFATFKDGSKSSADIANYNAGIILYHKNNLDLGKLANYLDNIDLINEDNLKFADQVGHASSLNNLKPLPAQERYLIKGKITDQAVVKHYIGPQRSKFYWEGLELIKDKILQ